MDYYNRTSPTMNVDILGTAYRIYTDVPEAEDKILETSAGYCDETVKMIAICREEPDDDIGDFAEHRKRVLRHEIIHAFLFESGLGNETVWAKDEGEHHSEQMVDWMARQFPKIVKAFKCVGAL